MQHLVGIVRSAIGFQSRTAGAQLVRPGAGIDGGRLGVVQAGDSRSQDRQLHEVAAVERQGRYGGLVDHLPHRGAFGLQQLCRGGHFHALLKGAHFHVEIEPGLLADLQLDSVERHGVEAGCEAETE